MRKLVWLPAVAAVGVGVLPLGGAAAPQGSKLLGIAEVLTGSQPDRGTFVAVGGMKDKGTFSDRASLGGAPSGGTLTINVTSTLKGKKGTVVIKEKVSFKSISGTSTGISSLKFTLRGKSGRWKNLRGSGTGHAVTYPQEHRVYVLQGTVK